MVKDIKDVIINRLADFLTDYKKADFSYDIKSNKFASQSKKFYVRLKGSSSTNGNINLLTMNHTVEIGLTDCYVSPNKMNDDVMSDIIASLQDKCLFIYKELEKRLAGTNIIKISELSISSPEILSEERVINQTFTINVKYHL